MPLINDWRDDEHYPEVCKKISEMVYPEELRSALPGPTPDRNQVKRWFARQTNTGDAAASQMAAFYMLLCEADPKKANDESSPVGKGKTAKLTKPTDRNKGQKILSLPDTLPYQTTRVEMPTTLSETPLRRGTPSLHIDIQIHISADASAEQIDLIRHIQLTASAIQTEACNIGLGPGVKEAAPLELFDRLITIHEIRQATRELYQSGYYALSVEECYKCLCNMVKRRCKLLDKSGKELDGWDLMIQIFDEKNPTIALNTLKTESDVNEQRGYRFIFAGVMAGIRNPRAHDHAYMDEADRALEMLAWGNHLAAKLKAAKKKRKKVP